jgi:hypothetical protein
LEAEKSGNDVLYNGIRNRYTSARQVIKLGIVQAYVETVNVEGRNNASCRWTKVGYREPYAIAGRSDDASVTSTERSSRKE